MRKLPFTKEFLVNQYRKDLSDLLDECDWIDTVDPWIICDLVSKICSQNGVDIDPYTLSDLYTEEVNSFALTTEQWREQYANWDTGVTKIIELIYEIIEKEL